MGRCLVFRLKNTEFIRAFTHKPETGQRAIAREALRRNVFSPTLAIRRVARQRQGYQSHTCFHPQPAGNLARLPPASVEIRVIAHAEAISNVLSPTPADEVGYNRPHQDRGNVLSPTPRPIDTCFHTRSAQGGRRKSLAACHFITRMVSNRETTVIGIGPVQITLGLFHSPVKDIRVFAHAGSCYRPRKTRVFIHALHVLSPTPMLKKRPKMLKFSERYLTGFRT